MTCISVNCDGLLCFAGVMAPLFFIAAQCECVVHFILVHQSSPYSPSASDLPRLLDI